MRERGREREVKIVIIGVIGVGKSSETGTVFSKNGTG